MNKGFYRHNDRLFIILKEINKDIIKGKDGKANLDLLKGWRDWVGADHVLRVNDSYLLCETVKELEFEEIIKEVVV